MVLTMDFSMMEQKIVENKIWSVTEKGGDECGRLELT